MPDVRTFTISRLGREGDGLADLDGTTIAVEGALPGERVRAVPGEGRNLASLVEVFEPSPDRAQPICMYFGTCGGCRLQHVSLSAQAAFKRQLVVDALARAAVDAEVGPTIIAHGTGRRRVTLHAGPEGAGYYRRRSHDLLPIDACPILDPALSRAQDVANAAFQTLGRCQVALTAADNGLDMAITGKGRPSAPALVALARKTGVLRLTFNGDLAFQAAPPVAKMGQAEVPIPPSSFLQATREAEEILAGLVLDSVGKAKRVADLFCGVGPFALRLAEYARVDAFDSDEAAVLSLDKAWRSAPGLRPVNAEARDLMAEPLVDVELKSYDAVVLDPPRAGARAQCRELARSQVNRITYVSCDPASFARDADVLVSAGFVLNSVQLVDQFAHAAHVELVGQFTRKIQR